MESEIAYTVVVHNRLSIGSILSLEVYKTPSKVTDANNVLNIPMRNGFSAIRMPFKEIIEKDKMYYYRHCGVERAVAANRTTPIEALRDALNCLMEKNPTTLEPHLLSIIMGKIINTLRLMYQDDNIYTVGFVMNQDQTYLLNYNTKDDVITVHDDFLIH